MRYTIHFDIDGTIRPKGEMIGNDPQIFASFARFARWMAATGSEFAIKFRTFGSYLPAISRRFGRPTARESGVFHRRPDGEIFLVLGTWDARDTRYLPANFTKERLEIEYKVGLPEKMAERIRVLQGRPAISQEFRRDGPAGYVEDAEVWVSSGFTLGKYWPDPVEGEVSIFVDDIAQAVDGSPGSRKHFIHADTVSAAIQSDYYVEKIGPIIKKYQND